MNIAVLAGGLSTERNISFLSGVNICRALRERGHRAAVVDLYMGFEGLDLAPKDAFDVPDGLVSTIPAAAVPLRAAAFLARAFWNSALRRILCFWRCMASAARTGAFRLLLT